MAEFCQNCYGVVNIKFGSESIEFTEADIRVQPLDFFRRKKPNGKFVVERATPAVQFTSQMPCDRKVQDVLKLCNGTLVINECCGRVWVLEKASATWDDMPYSAKEGEVTLTFIGTKFRELLAQAA